MVFIILIAILVGYFVVGLALCFMEARNDKCNSLTDDDLAMYLIAWPIVLLDAIAGFIVMCMFYLVHKIRELAKKKK